MAASNPLDRDVYFNTPGVASVKWDQGASAVHVEWEGWADSTEFTTLLNAGVQALTDHHGSRWLADCRRQRVLKPADQEWGDKVWLPRAVAAGLKRFAVVLPTSGLAAMNLKDHENTLRKTGLDVGYFATVEDARQWLAR
jgi:hypothetical protein